MHLSTDRFVTGLRCPKRLWLDTHSPLLIPSDSDTQVFRREELTELVTYVQKFHGAGTLVPVEPRHPATAVAATRKALADGATRIYQAAFEANGLLDAADIIERLDDSSWRLIRIQATTRPAGDDVPALALQWHLMHSNGLRVREAVVMHLDRNCVWPDVCRLVTWTDLSAEVSAVLSSVSRLAGDFIAIADKPSAPQVEPGSQCGPVGACPYQEHCRAALQHGDLHTLPGLDTWQENRLRLQGWSHIAEVAELSSLNPQQQGWVQAIQDNQPYIDATPIQHWVGRLEWPLRALQIRTITYATPRWDGTRPFQPVAVQFSCHEQAADGFRTHHEHLHLERTDPRIEVAASLANALDGTGTILVWDATETRRILLALARALPHYRQALLSSLPRLLGMSDLFQFAFLHPRALGATSIADTGRAILGDKGLYDGMVIAPGEETFPAWHEVVFRCGDRRIIDDLRAYCCQDSAFLLRLLEVARKAAGVGPRKAHPRNSFTRIRSPSAAPPVTPSLKTAIPVRPSKGPGRFLGR